MHKHVQLDSEEEEEEEELLQLNRIDKETSSSLMPNHLWRYILMDSESGWRLTQEQQ